MNEESEEKLVTVGRWLYDNCIECEVHLVERSISYGSGDVDDPPEIREDRMGKFYYLKFLEPLEQNTFNSESGSFETIADAKEYARGICRNLKWK